MWEQVTLYTAGILGFALHGNYTSESRQREDGLERFHSPTFAFDGLYQFVSCGEYIQS